MARSQLSDRAPSSAAAGATLAKALAPEEIYQGDYVTPLSTTYEIPSFWWCAESWRLPLEEPVRVRYMSSCDGVPLRVQSVCLPFVLAKNPNGQSVTIDVRRCQLARLDREFAKRAWKCIKRSQRRNSGKAASQWTA
jgi:hypothetical protein